MSLRFTGRTESGRERSGGSSVPLAPLIDMVFILLIFFLVSASFTEQTSVNVDRPETVSGRKLEEEHYVVSITKEGTLFFENRPVNPVSLKSRIQSEVARPEKASFVLAADESVSVDRLLSVMDRIKEAGIRNVSIGTKRTRK